MNGKISHWYDQNGFCFIVSDDGAEKVFFHISSVKPSIRRPLVDDSVVYESSLDAKIRLQAKAVLIEGVVAQSGERKSQFIEAASIQVKYLLFRADRGLVGMHGKSRMGFLSDSVD